MAEKTSASKKKKLSFNEIRVNEEMAILKVIQKDYNLSFGEASKYAEIIDSYKYGGNFKRNNKYKGNDNIILKFLPNSAIEQKTTSILNQ